MTKIMLVIDDYNEMVFIETLLKRMGFDVLSLSKDSNLGDALVGFFPSLVMAMYKRPTVDGIKVSIHVKRQVGNAKVVLLYPQGSVPKLSAEQKSKIDALIEVPIQPQDTLLIIAQLLKLDGTALIEKYDKLSKARQFSRENEMKVLKDEGSKKTTPPIVISGPAGGFGGGQGRPADAPKTEREKKYDAFLAKMNEPVETVIPHERIAKAEKELAEAAKSEEKELAEINEQKKEFVRAMMKKAKGE
ncbi:MAG: hypothetical protein NDI61_10285 [Bdellovibrionaceae bacterium]|nr:hypothetical protein [Pseudobdellovibrionaceae bacterium]